MIVLYALLGLAAVLFAVGMIGPTSEAMEQFIGVIRELAKAGLYWLVLLSPLFIILAFFIALKDKGIKGLAFAGIYGLIIMLIFQQLGLFELIYQLMEDQLFYSSITGAISGAGHAVFGFLCGIAARACDLALSAGGFIGRLTRRLRRWFRRHASW